MHLQLLFSIEFYYCELSYCIRFHLTFQKAGVCVENFDWFSSTGTCAHTILFVRMCACFFFINVCERSFGDW